MNSYIWDDNMGNDTAETLNKQMLINDSIGKKILDAAMEIIDSEGYDNLTIRRVAKASGCSNSAIYVRFEDKDELIRAVAALHSEPFLTAMDDNYVQGDDIAVNIKRMMQNTLEKIFSLDIGSVQMQFFYRAGLMPDENPFVQKLEGYIKSAMMRGEISTKSPRSFAYALESTFWGVAYMLRGSEDRGMGLTEAKKMLDFYFDMQFAGVKEKTSEDQFWDLLVEKGVDVEKALERMKGNKEAYKSFLIEFFEDPDFEALGEALEQENTREAFEYAHGLKGMAANLGLDCIHEKISELVEILRPGGIEGAKEAYAQTIEACEVIRQML